MSAMSRSNSYTPTGICKRNIKEKEKWMKLLKSIKYSVERVASPKVYLHTKLFVFDTLLHSKLITLAFSFV